jgi:hypothetical protein
MVVSGTQDEYSRDADQVVGTRHRRLHHRAQKVGREHALDQERFDAIVEWIVGRDIDRRERTPTYRGASFR